MNTWLKVTINTEPKNIEIVCGALISIGLDAVEIDDPAENLRFLNEGEAQNWDYLDEAVPTEGSPVVRFYLSPDENRWSREEIAAAVGDLGAVSFEQVEDDWSDAWLAHYKPFKIGERVVIRPFWEEYSPADGEVVFTIDPGHVFGTGQHQSTALCIQMLEKHVRAGQTALDVGCGSGILGIIALLLGAKHVTGVDIDPAAVKMMKINADLNSIPESSYTALCANLIAENPLQDKFDIVIANIVADVIIPLAPVVAGMVADGGLFITSGIITERVDGVKAALKSAGFEVLETLEQDGWVAICSRS